MTGEFYRSPIGVFHFLIKTLEVLGGEFLDRTTALALVAIGKVRHLSPFQGSMVGGSLIVNPEAAFIKGFQRRGAL